MYKIISKQGCNYFRNYDVMSPIPPTDTPEREFVQHTKALVFWFIDNILIYKQHIKFCQASIEGLWWSQTDILENKDERAFKLNRIKKINLFMKQRRSKASKKSSYNLWFWWWNTVASILLIHFCRPAVMNQSIKYPPLLYLCFLLMVCICRLPRYQDASMS